MPGMDGTGPLGMGPGTGGGFGRCGYGRGRGRGRGYGYASVYGDAGNSIPAQPQAAANGQEEKSEAQAYKPDESLMAELNTLKQRSAALEEKIEKLTEAVAGLAAPKPEKISKPENKKKDDKFKK